MEPAVICLSGKRKSGKDYVAVQLKKLLEAKKVKVVIRGVSYPLKKEFARIHHLDYEKLKSDGPYKEVYRKPMVTWSEKIRCDDPDYFCRLAVKDVNDADVVIISDCRRPTDIQFFRKNFLHTRFVRVVADVKVRESRGFCFTKGVDDEETECALDNFSEWDTVIENNQNNTSSEVFESSLFNQLSKLAVDLLFP
uniref:Phosphomevalonate kinase n=1 Tax=Syphacia muris TaxID=451379 RepID=A0A0N5AUC6_9BILA